MKRRNRVIEDISLFRTYGKICKIPVMELKNPNYNKVFNFKRKEAFGYSFPLIIGIIQGMKYSIENFGINQNSSKDEITASISATEATIANYAVLSMSSASVASYVNLGCLIYIYGEIGGLLPENYNNSNEFMKELSTNSRKIGLYIKNDELLSSIKKGIDETLSYGIKFVCRNENNIFGFSFASNGKITTTEENNTLVTFFNDEESRFYYEETIRKIGLD